MKIAFFESSESDKVYLRAALEPDHEIVFCPEPIDEHNVAIASDADILSVFIYSNLGEEILRRVPQVRCIVTRSTGFDHVDLD